MWQHPVPFGPIVDPSGPHVQPMVDLAGMQYARHPIIVLFANVMFARPEDDAHVADIVQIPAWAKIGHILHRIVEINVVIGEAPHKRTNVKSAPQTEHVAYLIGVTEREIEGMVATKATPGHGHIAPARLVHGPINDFVQDQIVVNLLVGYFLCRVNAPIIETVIVQTAWTIYFYAASIDKPSNGIDQAKIFVLVVAAH